MSKKTTRMVLDLLLTVMIVFEMLIEFTGDYLHEIIGFAFFATVVVHLVLSAKWMKGTVRAARAGKMNGRRKALAVVACLLAVAMIVLGVSSVAISDVLASAGLVWTLGSYSTWVMLHGFSSYMLCALVVVHLAMHWTFLASPFKIPYDPSRRRAIGVGVKTVAAVGAVVLVGMAAKEVLPAGIASASSSGNGNAGAGNTGAAGSSSTSFSDDSFSEELPNTTGVSNRKRDDAESASSVSTLEKEPIQPEQDAAYEDGEVQGGASSSAGYSSVEVPVSSNEPEIPSAASDNGSVQDDEPIAATGTCPLCRKQCPLSAPRCNRPYQKGLI